MELNQELLDKAVRAWAQCSSDARTSVAAAIKTYLTAALIKPDKGMILEPLDAIPQRDYRKELWTAALTTGKGAPWADQALAHFDKTFPQEKPHG